MAHINDIHSSTAVVVNTLTSSAVVRSIIKSAATILQGGINPDLCPLIDCIDGGAPDSVFIPVRGVVIGGTP